MATFGKYTELYNSLWVEYKQTCSNGFVYIYAVQHFFIGVQGLYSLLSSTL